MLIWLLRDGHWWPEHAGLFLRTIPALIGTAVKNKCSTLLATNEIVFQTLLVSGNINRKQVLSPGLENRH
jgi:hypothetical protein